MSDENILETLQLMLQARSDFLSNTTIRSLDYNTRASLISRFMNNDAALLEFLNRMYIINSQARAAPTAFITLNMPTNNSNFMEPVVVAPTAQQIEGALVNMEEAEGTCAICQDAIASGGCRIRQCTHEFHRACITNWFTMSVRCPVCRYDIRGGNQTIQTSPASSQRSAQSGDQSEEH
jgi:hypothetical protein